MTQIPSIEINTDFSQFLNKDNQAYAFYDSVNDKLKKDESLLILAIQNKTGVLEQSFLQKVDSLSREIKKIDAVDKVHAITNISYPIKSLFGISQIPYLNLEEDSTTEDFKSSICRDQTITSNFINDDRTALLIWISLNPKISEKATKKALKQIEQLRDNFGNYQSFLWGKKYIKLSIDSISAQETSKNIFWSFILLIAILTLIFKRFRAILLALFFVSVCILIFYGFMVFLNRPFGLMSNLYPTIIVIVGISDFIHMAVKYNREVESGTAPSKVFQTSMSEISRAIFITSLTTAVGFFTLMFSPMEAMRGFGLEAGLAVLLTYVLFLCLAPTIFGKSKKPTVFEFRPKFQRATDWLIKASIKTHLHPYKTIFVAFSLTVTSLWGMNYINTNNLQYTIPEQSGLHTDRSFFDNALGGSRSFELYFESKNGDPINTAEHLSSLHRTAQYLENLPEVNKVKSPTFIYQLVHRAYEPTADWSRFDISDAQLKKYHNDFSRIQSSEFLLSKDKSLIKLSAHMKDLGRLQVGQKNEEIISTINTLIDTSKVNVSINGLDHLFDQTHQDRIDNMFKGLLLAIVIVAMVLGFIFRNIAIVALTLLLNILPLILTAGIMGITNLELRAGTTVIFTVAFVIVVDDTVHLLSKFNLERKKGKSIQRALNETLAHCGSAIFTTSLILIGAFGVLAFSGLREVFTFGILIGVAIIIALITDLVLAPILIKKWFKKHL
nr:MMPL family transporter [uncultured Allomuricauda sp.]